MLAIGACACLTGATSYVAIGKWAAAQGRAVLDCLGEGVGGRSPGECAARSRSSRPRRTPWRRATPQSRPPLPDTANRVVSPQSAVRSSMAVGPVVLPTSGHAVWDDLATWWLSRYKVSTQQTYATYLPRWTAWCTGCGLDPLARRPRRHRAVAAHGRRLRAVPGLDRRALRRGRQHLPVGVRGGAHRHQPVYPHRPAEGVA